MKKGKNMINQKNDLNMITRKLETELLTFHFDGLEISEITTTTSWMKLHINVLFIKDDVQITKVLYKDYETGLWYYIKDNGKYGKGVVRTRPCFYRGKRSTNYMIIEYWVTRDDIHKRLTGESEV